VLPPGARGTNPGEPVHEINAEFNGNLIPTEMRSCQREPAYP